jgi:class 3 adenylate cyclase
MPIGGTNTGAKANDAETLPKIRIAISTALMLGFGILVFAAAASILGIGLWSAHQNTITLLRDRAELSVDLLVERVRGHLGPVMESNAHLADMIASGEAGPEDPVQLAEYMEAAIAATPQVRGMTFIRTDFTAIRLTRGKEGFGVRISDWSGNPNLERRMDEARGAEFPYWGELFWASTSKVTLLNRRAPVRKNGRFIGMLISVVSLADLSLFLKQADRESGNLHSFLLYGSNHVLAHPNMAAGGYQRAERFPIPSLAQIGDPILTNVWNKNFRRPGIPLSPKTQGHLLDIDDTSYAVFYRELEGYAVGPLLAGSYAPIDGGFGAEYQRLFLAAAIGASILLIAVIGALWLGRRMALPIKGLAAAAEKVRGLRLDPPPVIRRSRLAEMDDAATAFNSMISGLRWFETYVPRTLVQSLMAGGDEPLGTSAEQVVSVLFTDIRNFTTRVENMEAADTAAFLNDHFSTVAQSIKSEAGTIDKYIGDSVMAYWGAPQPIDDHAQRACRTAIGIRDSIGRLNTQAAEQGVAPLKMGIGIHCGPVLAGNIGAPGRVNYTLVGDTVNLALRLEQLTKPLVDPDHAVTILVSKDVAELVGDEIDLIPCGEHDIRGRVATIDVYRIK